MTHIPTTVYLKLIGAALLWGGTFIAGRELSQTVPPLISATSRFFVAAVILLLWLYKTEGHFPRLKAKQLAFTIAAGVTGIFLYNIFFFGALAEIPAGRTALFVSLNPIFTAIFLFIFFRERLGTIRWMGIFLALIGTTVIVTRGDIVSTMIDISSALGTGELMMLGAVVSWSSYTILGRFSLNTLSPLVATTYATCVGFVLLLIVTIFYHADTNTNTLSQLMTLKNTSAILYLGVLGTVVGFVWYYQGVAAIGASRAAIFTNLVPVFGVILGFVLLGESILLSMVIGGVITIVGVTITNRKPKEIAPIVTAQVAANAV